MGGGHGSRRAAAMARACGNCSAAPGSLLGCCWVAEINLVRLALLGALAPDGRDWVDGCQGDGWNLGPASPVVAPPELLAAAQRLELEGLLRQACRWAPPLVSSDWLLPPASPWPRIGKVGRGDSEAMLMPVHFCTDSDWIPHLQALA